LENKKRTLNELRQVKDTVYTGNKKHKVKKESKTSTIEFVYNWKAHMKSLILFMEMGNDDNRNFAKDELMKLAEKLDNLSEGQPKSFDDLPIV